MIERYRVALADVMQLPVARFDEPGVTVVPGEDRRGERLVSHYRVGEHDVIWVDPDVAEEIGTWNGRRAPVPFDEFRGWVLDRGAERLGAGYEHLLPEGVTLPPRPPQVRLLDGADAEVEALAGALLRACTPDDLEEADFDLDALDELLAGWVEDGRLLALAGGRPFEPRPGYLDVGVLVHPTGRRAGRGRHVIAAVVESVLAAGRPPLYRCSVDNEASWRLCRGLGFVPVLELEAFRWPAVAT